jgi:universal stress protein A
MLPLYASRCATKSPAPAFKSVEIVKAVNLVYVSMPIVYLQPFLYGGEFDTTTDSENIANAKQRLKEIADKFGINKKMFT